MAVFKNDRHNMFLNFYSYRKFGFCFSAILSIAVFISFYIHGLNLGIDFKGGVIIEFYSEKKDIYSLVKNKFDKRSASIILAENQNIIIQLAKNNTGPSQFKSMIFELDENADIKKIDFVGAKISEQLVENSVYAFLSALLAIMIYIFFRFSFVFSFAAILALIHDLIAMIGFFVFTRYEFNLTSVAAILTILGYSVNDSVVIFDRIRENIKKYNKILDKEVIDQSINQTMSRTIMTFLTTFVACLALSIFGGNTLQGFSASITFGIAFGTYSSIFIASNIIPFLKDINVSKKNVSKKNFKKEKHRSVKKRL